ncbi:MAG TPA: type II toxin-antitoxin system RelE/ParE family toxin [Acidobacteriaceae bacterium]|nr:type II toxin-antitoxin system RelE/ParE family toxin [Acidobacteriaceae bacterium]
MKFRLLPQAQDDLRSIDNWIVEHFGETFADNAQHKLYETFELLSEFQNMGHRRPDVTAKAVLFFSHSPHWIIYSQGQPLIIHRIFPARTDIRNLTL